MSDTDDYEAEYERLWKATVETLTAAARLEHPSDTERFDFADFVTTALRATIANVGDPGPLIAGRHNPWEVIELRDVVDRIIGDRPDMFELAAYRTEPIHVQLHVANLVWDNADGPGTLEEFDDAVDRVGDDNGARALITQQYTAAYQSYADQFAAAVRTEAGKRPGLAELVTIDVDTSLLWQSEPEIDNPIEGDCDPLAWHFWRRGAGCLRHPAGSGRARADCAGRRRDRRSPRPDRP